MVNYFEIFQLPIDFNIDNSQLDTTFRQLQSQYHPDVFNQNNPTTLVTSLDHLTAEQASAVVNTAYKTLKNPDSRAVHLLELAGQGNGLNDSIRDLDFLDKAMDLRILLEDASAEELPLLKDDLQHWITAVEQNFNQSFIAKNWQSTKSATQQLKFLIKLQNDFAKKTDKLAQQTQNNDDDLYV